jgi:hypothetical protein
MSRQARSATAEPMGIDQPRLLLDSAEETATPPPAAPLTAALLRVATHGLSFATPGHRGGRSCAPRD